MSAEGPLNRDNFVIMRKWCYNLSWIKSIIWIKRFLDTSQILMKFFSKKFCCVFTAETASVLAPHNTIIFFHKFNYFIRKFPDPTFFFRILQIQSRTHMQTPNIHMTKHGILQTIRFEQCPELPYVISQVFRWNCSIFHKRKRLPLTFCVA